MAWLPDSLPEMAVPLWESPMPGDGLGGLAAADGLVFWSGRDATDTSDVFICLDAEFGLPLWTVQWPAAGKLDYGNSPRATPLIHEGRVYLQGAFGDLACVDVVSGEIAWQRNIVRDFGAKPLTWGVAGSPLLADGKLIVQPGAPDAAIIALKPDTGVVVWKSAGLPSGYSSCIVAGPAQQRQIVGYDSRSLGGWDIATGRQLWTVVPEFPGDFNVPTPIAINDGLVLVSESNGTRRHRFNADGILSAKPEAHSEDLAPDSHTPVISGGRLFGVWNGLHCLDANTLQTVWTGEDDAFFQYAALVASPSRVLAVSVAGELILIDSQADEFRILGRLALSDDGTETLSHPAIVGNRLFIRLGRMMRCYELSADGG